jgi:hypothetical protein
MVQVECCERWGHRLYYSIMAGVYIIMLITTLVTLGTFGVQFSKTMSFHYTSTGRSAVCVLYGTEPEQNDAFNVRLTNNASCGFTLWGLVTIVLVLVVWIALHVVLALIGKPKA